MLFDEAMEEQTPRAYSFVASEELAILLPSCWAVKCACSRVGSPQEYQPSPTLPSMPPESPSCSNLRK